MDGRCNCSIPDCKCTDESHRNERQTLIDDTKYNCINHWVRVAYEKSKKSVPWKTWLEMVDRVMEDTIEYFWHCATFDEYLAVWEEEIRAEKEDCVIDHDRCLQLDEYLHHLQELIYAGFDPKHSYNDHEGLWTWRC